MNVIFRGTATAMVTPFLENGEVDYETFARQIEFQIAGGTDALVILHSNSLYTILWDKSMENMHDKKKKQTQSSLLYAENGT